MCLLNLLTIGWFFRFCIPSLSFFQVGIVLSFSLRRACSSKIGLKKKTKHYHLFENLFVECGRAINFVHEYHLLCRFCYFRCCRLLFIFWPQHLFSLFPSFFTLCKNWICRAMASHFRWRHTSELPTLAFLSFRRKEFARGGGTMVFHYIILDQSTHRIFEFACFPAWYFSKYGIGVGNVCIHHFRFPSSWLRRKHRFCARLCLCWIYKLTHRPEFSMGFFVYRHYGV